MTLTTTIRDVQRALGYPRFNFIKDEEIVEIVQDVCIRDFTQKFPYITLYLLHPKTDAVDPERFPGLMKIEPLDAGPECIYDVGCAYCAADLAMGGYPRDMGRTIYGGSLGIGAALYNQLNINMMSMVQPQQITTEYIQPNFVQLYPKRRFMFGYDHQVAIQLLCYHAKDLHTIPNAYDKLWRELCILQVKDTIYQRYKDWEDETVAGHQIRTKIQSFADAASDLQSWYDKADDECYRNPDRLDLYVV